MSPYKSEDLPSEDDESDEPDEEETERDGGRESAEQNPR